MKVTLEQKRVVFDVDFMAHVAGLDWIVYESGAEKANLNHQRKKKSYLSEVPKAVWKPGVHFRARFIQNIPIWKKKKVEDKINFIYLPKVFLLISTCEIYVCLDLYFDWDVESVIM